MEFDTSTEPPTLRLQNVSANVLYGKTGENGFAANPQDADGGHILISGDYTGPGSTLETQ